MTRVLLGVALVVSLWPAAVIALAADRVLGGGGDEAAPTATTQARTTKAQAAAPRARPRPEPAAASEPSPATTATQPAASTAATPREPGEPDLVRLDRLRDDTADLVVAASESVAVAGQPDDELAAEALRLEGEIVAWQEANEGTNPDAEFFAALFADIASAAADFATAPGPESKDRLEEAVERHRRETLQDGA